LFSGFLGSKNFCRFIRQTGHCLTNG
jgi:hypothetical protein